jgi:hypothetical protein
MSTSCSLYATTAAEDESADAYSLRMRAVLSLSRRSGRPMAT